MTQHIYVVGDGITDNYIVVEKIGVGDEGVSPRFRVTDRFFRRGGANFVNDSLWDQVEDDFVMPDEIHLEEVYYASEYYIDRYMLDRTTPLSIVLTNEDEPTYFPEGSVRFSNWTKDSYVILWDADRGYHHTTTLQDAYARAREVGATIIVDCASPDILERYPDADIYKLNGQEYMAMHKNGYPNLKKRLLIVTGPMVNSIIGTYKGYWETTIRVPNDMIITDTIGAGDVFLARMVYLLARGNGVDYAVREAGKLATESTKHVGCYFPDKEKEGEHNG